MGVGDLGKSGSGGASWKTAIVFRVPRGERGCVFDGGGILSGVEIRGGVVRECDETERTGCCCKLLDDF